MRVVWGSNYTERKKKEASWFHLLLEKFNVPNCNIAATLKENLDLLPLMFSNLKQSAVKKIKKGETIHDQADTGSFNMIRGLQVGTTEIFYTCYGLDD